MDNKKNLIIAGVLGGIFLIATVVFYLQKNSLLSAINRLHEESQTVRSLEELQQKVNDFFAATNVSTVSFLRSKASGTSGIAITGIKEKTVSVGSKVTITGLGLNLPAFAVIDGSVVATPLTSETPDEISFIMPSVLIAPTCPPFPESVCGLSRGGQSSITPGTHTLHIVSGSGTVSNGFVFTVQ